MKIRMMVLIASLLLSCKQPVKSIADSSKSNVLNSTDNYNLLNQKKAVEIKKANGSLACCVAPPSRFTYHQIVKKK